MPNGYDGKILRVDLSSSDLSVEEPSEEFYRKYMGSSALNLCYLLNEMPSGADPLGPYNMLGLGLGVVTGAPISGQSRMTATAKFLLTGAIGDSQCECTITSCWDATRVSRRAKGVKPVTGASSVVSALSKSKTDPFRSIRFTADPNTKPCVLSEAIAVLMIWLRYPRPMRYATPMESTPFPAERL